MSFLIDPPLDQWSLKPVAGGADRRPLLACLEANAQHLGTAAPPGQGALIATGHQAWLWHPGILAKDLAAVAAAERLGAGVYHVVVDQDAQSAFQLELPVVGNERLGVEVLTLGSVRQHVATGYQAPVDPRVVCDRLLDAKRRLGKTLAADITPLIDAFAGLPACHSLAQQVAAAVDRLRRGATGWSLPVLFASDLSRVGGFASVVEQMRRDARACALRYNEAVRSVPGAGVTPLRVEPARVELPLWALRWNTPRRRVFADLASDQTRLTLDSGEPIHLDDPSRPHTPRRDGGWVLGPRALLLTAVLRRWCCDFFVHGKGGGLYDRVTEQWWKSWTGQDLAPTAVVSADVTLPFDAPVATESQLHHAVWWAQHVGHNIDRVMADPEADPDVVRKRFLLDHMDDDRNAARRAAAFEEIHQINDRLRQNHRDIVDAAQAQLKRARLGVVNRDVVQKRDWCFGLYPRSAMTLPVQSAVGG